MNKQTFQEILKSPQQLTDGQLKDLEELVANFPYCQIAHVLIAKAYRDRGYMLSDKKLKTAAAYTSSRKNLKNMILVSEEASTDETNVPEVIEEKQKLVSDVDVAAMIGDETALIIEQNDFIAVPKLASEDLIKKPTKIEEKITFKSEPSKSSKEIADELQTTLTRMRELREAARESVKEEETKTKESKEVVPEDVIESKSSERQVVEYQKIEQKEVKSKEDKKESPKKEPKEVESSPSEDDVLERIQKLSDEARKKAKANKEITRRKKKEITQEERESKKVVYQNFSSRLEDILTEFHIADSGTKKESDLLLDYISNRRTRKKTDQAEKKQPVSKKNAAPKKQNDIIDSFIENEPSISRPSDSNTKGSDENLAAKSVGENMKLVTENMAKINVKQGNVTKAIKIYEALKQKYPDKKLYFESLIEKLRNN